MKLWKVVTEVWHNLEDLTAVWQLDACHVRALVVERLGVTSILLSIV